ncbi:DNA polymerase III subunit beta [Sulfobacillus thermotolerans]|uniref:Beta sliding clamp n=1 Tax=Sulfobacillus thermotolerans TaxID=338644 RepID=A0ABM6RMK5_9FIRM|nr:DNA polymerase III subunit beta [Sulfobacillus thermotolerans]
MHFSAAQDLTTRALQQVGRVIQPQNTMAVLAGIQLQAENGRLLLSATDLSSHIAAEIPCDVQEPGSVVLPGSTLTELIQRLPTATFDLTSDPNTGRSTIRYGRNKAIINGYGQELLPTFPMLEDTQARLELPTGTLGTLSRQLLFAVSREDSRPILKGVYVKLGTGRLVFVSTDGTRLSHSWLPIPDYRGPQKEVVLPHKFFSEGARLNQNNPVTLTLGTGLVELTAPGTTFTTRLLEGQFPDYDRVIPQEFIAECRVSIADLRGSLERVNLLAAKDHSTPVAVHLEDGTIDLSTQTADIGQAQETVEAQTHGQALDILFNPTYILDALKALEGDEALLQFSGIQSPAKIMDAEGAQYFHVLLPLRQMI